MIMKKILILMTLLILSVSSYANRGLKLPLSQFGIEVPKLTNGLTFTSNLLDVKTDVNGVGRNFNIYIGPTYSANGVGVMTYGDFETPMIVDNLTIGPYVGFGFGYAYNPKADYNLGWDGGYRGNYQTTPMVSFGAVAHYYFDWLIPNMQEKYDVFAKMKIGGNLGFESFAGFVPDVDAQVGARIHVSSMSLYGTVGYGRSYVNLGLSFGL
jgi:hypothetical protein